jgi:NADPH:quinone reductase
MRNLITYYEGAELKTKLETDTPVWPYGDNDVLIKTAAVSSNPKDWKHPMPNYFNNAVNQGDDVGGVVEAVGKDVKSFHKGDRVAGFHVMDTETGGA